MVATKTAPTKVSSVTDVIKNSLKKHDLRIGPLSFVSDEVAALTTGNLSIDYSIGVGGLPLGRSVELFGPPGCGKTTTGLQTAAELQRRIIEQNLDEYILYSDYEHALDKKYAAALGLDVDHKSFLFTQPDTFEQGANAARELIETGQIRLAIWDSVASMTPASMAEAEVGKSLPAIQARLMADFLRKLNPLLHAKNCCAVFLNHEMEVMSMGRPGPPRTSTPGGKALKYYASLRLQYQQIGNIKGSSIDILSGEKVQRTEAVTVRVRVVKNKVAPPFRECQVRVRFGKGFDNFWSALQVLIGNKKIKLSAGYYYFNESPELVIDDMLRTPTDRPYVRGEEAILKFADQRPEWRASVIKSAYDLVENGVETVLESDDSDDEESDDDGEGKAWSTPEPLMDESLPV